MSPVVVACFISLALLCIFPASAVGRLGPGEVPSLETISAQAKLDEAAPEMESQSIKAMDAKLPQDVAAMFDMIQGESSSRGRGLVGSSPPTCRGRCGSCTPCKAVHVAIGSPHGVISETEYYPEVWRCQCANRYYMP